MSSDDGWEEVYKEDTNIKIDIKEKTNRINTKYDIFYSFINIIKEFTVPVDIPRIHEFMDFNIIKKMYHLIKTEDKLESSEYYFTDYIKNILFYKFLKEHKIYSRIYFVLHKKEISSFLEISVNNIIIKNNQKYKGCVFYIENDVIEDYTWYFSTDMKNHTLFLEVLKKIKNQFKKIIQISSDFKDKLFEDLDNERIKAIPSSIIKLRKHPLYCLESELKNNQILTEKTLQGFFKGEPVFLKKDILNLKSEKYFYRHGKEPKIKKDTNYYSEEEVQDIIVKDMNNQITQDYLHDNHIPINCVYIKNEYDEIVCQKLNIKYRRCFVGFNRQNPVYKGIFIYKKDLFLVSNFIFEYFDYFKKIEVKNRVTQIIKNWEKIVKLCKRYKTLKSRLL